MKIFVHLLLSAHVCFFSVYCHFNVKRFAIEYFMSKTQIDLAISARWIAPVVPKGALFENCTLTVHKGKIRAIVPTAQAEKEVIATEWLHLDSHILIPGLINSHGHAAMSLLRGYADDQPLKPWLEEHIWPAEKRWVDEDFVEDGSKLAIAEMLLSGTTCFSDMYFFPEVTAKVAFDAGIRAQLTFPITDSPTPWGSGPDEYFRKGLSLRDTYKSHDLITIAFGPHAPYTVSDDVLIKIATYAEELQTPIQIHLHETAEEIATSLNTFNMRPIERLEKLGLLSPLTQCVHMTQIHDSDIEILQRSGAHIVHCPESNLKLASGICPVDKLLKSGVNVSLGTDGAASNNDLNLLTELQTAALIGKYAANDAAAISAQTALEIATINGAKTLGIADKVGSLETGKAADIVALNLNHLSMSPIHNPLSQLVYSAANAKVEYVWVNGRALVKNAQLTTLKPKEIVAQAEKWRQKLS